MRNGVQYSNWINKIMFTLLSYYFTQGSVYLFGWFFFSFIFFHILIQILRHSSYRKCRNLQCNKLDSWKIFEKKKKKYWWNIVQVFNVLCVNWVCYNKSYLEHTEIIYLYSFWNMFSWWLVKLYYFKAGRFFFQPKGVI